jgi:DNA (cytosine-5)-methyltransferase 1
MHAWYTRPDHDLMTGGFPCQSFSTAGPGRGLSDPGGQLYLEVARLLRAAQPKALLLENVANLYVAGEGGKFACEFEQRQPGAIFRTIVAEFESCGYTVLARCINARGWLPQQRERVYFVGFRKDLAPGAVAAFRWPEPPAERQHSSLGDLLEAEPPPPPARWPFLTVAQWDAVRRMSVRDGLAGRIARRDGDARTVMALYRRKFDRFSEFVLEPAEGAAASGSVAPEPEPEPEPVTLGGCAELEGMVPRFYTPLEMSRIMGFDEGFVLHPNPSQCYLQLGNAVCPPVVGAIADNILKALGI